MSKRKSTSSLPMHTPFKIFPIIRPSPTSCQPGLHSTPMANTFLQRKSSAVISDPSKILCWHWRRSSIIPEAHSLTEPASQLPIKQERRNMLKGRLLSLSTMPEKIYKDLYHKTFLCIHDYPTSFQ